jgi:hypothetical protein
VASERSHLSTVEANSLARHARIIRARPLLSHALDTLGAGKVRTILRYTTGRTMDAFAEAEFEILQQAAQFSVDEMASIMRWWGRRVDQDGREPKAWDDCEIDLNKTYEGDYALNGGLDGLTGAELEAALDSEAESIYRAGGMGENRPTIAHRRAIALMALIRRALDPDAADTQVPPTVMVTVTLDELLKATGRAQLINTGEHIDAETARRIACDAGITRIITGPRGEILDLGRTIRSAPVRFKKALAVRCPHDFPTLRNRQGRAAHQMIAGWRSRVEERSDEARKPARPMDHHPGTRRHPPVPKTRRQLADHMSGHAMIERWTNRSRGWRSSPRTRATPAGTSSASAPWPRPVTTSTVRRGWSTPWWAATPASSTPAAAPAGSGDGCTSWVTESSASTSTRR